MSEPVPIRARPAPFKTPFKSFYSIPRMRYWLKDMGLIEIRCLHLIWESTVAYRRYRDSISMSQFSEYAGACRAACSGAIADLEKKGLIKVTRRRRACSIYEPLNPPFRG